jgi:hypothetical protein
MKLLTLFACTLFAGFAHPKHHPAFARIVEWATE